MKFINGKWHLTRVELHWKGWSDKVIDLLFPVPSVSEGKETFYDQDEARKIHNTPRARDLRKQHPSSEGKYLLQRSAHAVKAIQDILSLPAERRVEQIERALDKYLGNGPVSPEDLIRALKTEKRYSKYTISIKEDLSELQDPIGNLAVMSSLSGGVAQEPGKRPVTFALHLGRTAVTYPPTVPGISWTECDWLPYSNRFSSNKWASIENMLQEVRAKRLPGTMLHGTLETFLQDFLRTQVPVERTALRGDITGYLLRVVVTSDILLGASGSKYAERASMFLRCNYTPLEEPWAKQIFLLRTPEIKFHNGLCRLRWPGKDYYFANRETKVKNRRLFYHQIWAPEAAETAALIEGRKTKKAPAALSEWTKETLTSAREGTIRMLAADTPGEILPIFPKLFSKRYTVEDADVYQSRLKHTPAPITLIKTPDSWKCVESVEWEDISAGIGKDRLEKAVLKEVDRMMEEKPKPWEEYLSSHTLKKSVKQMADPQELKEFAEHAKDQIAMFFSMGTLNEGMQRVPVRTQAIEDKLSSLYTSTKEVIPALEVMYPEHLTNGNVAFIPPETLILVQAGARMGLFQDKKQAVDLCFQAWRNGWTVTLATYLTADKAPEIMLLKNPVIRQTPQGTEMQWEKSRFLWRDGKIQSEQTRNMA
jgi:hypothetical protein